ncbi:MAG TPA: hypothetical protein VGD01_18245 [Candidatus Elarobacter sp.]|jgi:hypothetical protein
MRIFRAAAAVVFAVGASAAPLSPPAASAAVDPCKLVTTAEASAAMGTRSLPGAPHKGRTGSSCRYYSADHKMNVFVQAIGPGDLQGAGQLGGKNVSGIGDQAIWASGSLFIRKGGNFAQVGLYRSAGSMEHMDPQIVPLGKVAASRM